MRGWMGTSKFRCVTAAARRPLARAFVGIALGWSMPVIAEQRASQPLEVADLAAALRGDDSIAWRVAADSLLMRLDDGAARAALQGALWDDRPVGVRRAVAEAVGGGAGDCSALARSLGTALAASLHEAAPTEDVLALVRALGRTRAKDAVRALVESVIMAEGMAPAVKQGAIDEVARMTGNVEWAADAEAIAAWWDRAQWQDDEEWRRTIGSGSRQLAKPIAPIGDRLTGLYRRLHAATPEAGRDALLVEMLESPEQAVRLAGFDLIMLSLVNAKPVGDSAAEAAASCLSDESPAIRAEAARTIELLGRAGDWALLWDRLAVERDDVAAAAMLRAGARHPALPLRDAALHWIESARDESTRLAAAEALEAARKAGFLNDSGSLDRARAAVRSKPSDGWTSEWFRLAVGVGLEAEVSRELECADRGAARRAAEALSENAAGLEALVRAAERHADLFASAASGLQRNAPSVDGYARLFALPAPNPQERTLALDAMVRAMPPMELGRLAAAESDLAAREALLAPIVTQEFLAATSDLTERVELALLLARTRVSLDRSADALATLALLPSGWQGPRALALRVTALLCMGRIADADQAAASGAPPEERVLPAEMLAEAWLEALEQCSGGASGPAIAAEFERRFDGSLSPGQASRWRALARP